ncbi:MAG: hypothetical protein FWD17_07485, partial [Polyangiaceae bacterium]|nr:hypothetical protein [Polyangiaceae bacterium]
MDSKITTSSRADVILVESTPRPTEAPPRVSFGQVLAASAAGLVAGAGAATARLPGAPLAAAAVRTMAGAGAASPAALPVAAGFAGELLPQGVTPPSAPSALARLATTAT